MEYKIVYALCPRFGCAMCVKRSECYPQDLIEIERTLACENSEQRDKTDLLSSS